MGLVKWIFNNPIYFLGPVMAVAYFKVGELTHDPIAFFFAGFFTHIAIDTIRWKRTIGRMKKDNAKMGKILTELEAMHRECSGCGKVPRVTKSVPVQIQTETVMGQDPDKQ